MTANAMPAPLPVASQEAALAPGQNLDYLPVGLFGSVMSLTGLSVAWRLAQRHFDLPGWIATAIGIAAIVVFVAVSAGYLVKCFSAPQAVLAEFAHPILGNLFGTVFISLLLVPIVLAPFSLVLAQALWVVGAVGMVVFAWAIVKRWMSDRQQIAHATPAWIIPVVGMLDVPLALPVLQLPSMHGVMVLGLAVGLFFAIPLFTMILMRLVFEPPMPEPLLPSLLILAAPFAVGMSTYVVVAGQVDLFAQSLYMLDLFVLATVLGRMRQLARCCPFKVSWWATGFPLAASAIAGLRMAIADPGWVTDAIAIALLALASLCIAALLVLTLAGIARGELRALSK